MYGLTVMQEQIDVLFFDVVLFCGVLGQLLHEMKFLV